MLGDMRYLGRYTHRVAISNHRLLAFDGNNVTFRWKRATHDGHHCRRVHPPVPAARAPEGLCPHPALRLYGQLPTLDVVRTLPPAAGNGTGGPFHRRSFNGLGLVVSPLSRANDCHRETHCDPDRLEIRFETLLRYLIEQIPNRNSHDVLLHACANVCLHLINPSSSSSEFQHRFGPPPRGRERAATQSGTIHLRSLHRSGTRRIFQPGCERVQKAGRPPASRSVPTCRG